MNGEPAVIITDQQLAIDVAIRNLKDNGDYQGEHLFDTFHLIRNIIKKTNNKLLVSAFRDAMFAKTPETYRVCLKNIRDLCTDQNEKTIYEKFLEKANRYCISQTPVCFHGISISTSAG